RDFHVTGVQTCALPILLPLHGVILLVGPPGTGKTSLARGLAHRIAESFKGQPFRLLEVEPHSLTSAMLGKSQRAVTDLFAKSIRSEERRVGKGGRRRRP